MKAKIIVFLDSKLMRLFYVFFVIFLILIVIILPIILTSRPKGAILAFNRDSNSGTREAFVEKVLNDDPDTFSPGSNVREVKNNDLMISAVKNNENSIGYVSFGTIAEFDIDGQPQLKEGINLIDFASFENIVPSKENIENEAYVPSRNFNIFFRIKNDSQESSILKYNWIDSTLPSDVSDEVMNLNANLKSSFLFFSWILYSKDAYYILDENSQIPTGILDETERIDFNDFVVESYISNTNLITTGNWEIEIVGSTSANSIVKKLSIFFEEKIESKYSNLDVIFTLATNGSSDAFSPIIPGTTEPYIGLQSREPKDSELEKWNWTMDDVETPYNSFAKDVILVIFNNKDISYSTRLNVNSETMNDLYSKGDYFYYSDIFTNFE